MKDFIRLLSLATIKHY